MDFNVGLRMKILIVDDHPLYIGGFRVFLQSLLQDAKVFEANALDRTLALCEANKFDLVLVDYKLAELSGLDVLQALRQRGVSTPLALISGEDAPAIAKRALDLGACGFIPKSLPGDQMAEAIITVLTGGEFLTDTTRRLVNQLDYQGYHDVDLADDPNSVFTKRQMDVIQLVAKGYSNKQISRVLNLSVHTVKEHMQNIFFKLEVDNRMLCVIRAKEMGVNVAY